MCVLTRHGLLVLFVVCLLACVFTQQPHHTMGLPHSLCHCRAGNCHHSARFPTRPSCCAVVLFGVAYLVCGLLHYFMWRDVASLCCVVCGTWRCVVLYCGDVRAGSHHEPLSTPVLVPRTVSGIFLPLDRCVNVGGVVDHSIILTLCCLCVCLWACMCVCVCVCVVPSTLACCHHSGNPLSFPDDLFFIHTRDEFQRSLVTVFEGVQRFQGQVLPGVRISPSMAPVLGVSIDLAQPRAPESICRDQSSRVVDHDAQLVSCSFSVPPDPVLQLQLARALTSVAPDLVSLRVRLVGSTFDAEAASDTSSTYVAWVLVLVCVCVDVAIILCAV